MARNIDAPCCKNYGTPLYGAAWVLPGAAVNTRSDEPKPDDSEEENESKSPAFVEDHIVVAGGGGEGRSGLANAFLVTRFDFESDVLADQPVARLGTGSDLPYRIAVHPGGEGLLCSFPQGCRWYEWGADSDPDNHSLNLISTEKKLNNLEDAGQQLALTFDKEGSVFAAGGEVFKWPSMEIMFEEANAHSRVKDLDFSPNGKLIASVGSGPARIWDLTSLISVASLPMEKDEIFCFCRFSRTSDENQLLYVAANAGNGGNIVKWNTTSWERISSTRVARDPITAFNVSPDGLRLALGTVEGDIVIVGSGSMRPLQIVRKAHLGIVTAVAFSRDSRALVSVSMDSRVRVTLINDKQRAGLNFWFVISFLLIAIAAYLVMKNNILPLKL